MQRFTKHIFLLILSILIAPFAGINLLAAQTNISTSDRAIASDLNSTEETKVQSLAENSLAQVTSVSQLSDVQPTDWAFQALQSLVERYGVIAGYPDGTFRGNRAMTRYEFAAGLNAALDRINELIATGNADTVSKDDLATIQRLQQEFAPELATLRGRVDTLEATTAELEANQFSTTTKLEGEVIFALISLIEGDNAAGEPVDTNPTASYRVRLNFQTSFTGQDQLTTRFQIGNVVPLGTTNSGETLTNEGRIEFDGDTGGQAQIGLLRYRFPVGDRTNIYLAAAGNGFVDVDASYQLTPFLDGNAVSLFGLRNPIYNYSAGTGLAVRHFFNDQIELNLGYLVPTNNASNPFPQNGLFDGTYAGLAQIIFNLSDNSRFGLSYINSYSPAGGDDPDVEPNTELTPFGTSTGSNLSNSSFGRPVSVNAYGFSGTFRLSPGLAISGWVGHANHRYIGRGDGSMWTWAASLNFPDLGKEGSVGGIIVGMEPRLTELDSNLGSPDRDTSLHLEAFYKYALTDNIQVTPAIIWLTAPDHNADNDDIIIGAIRTVFRF
ncbi:carbohydrate porin [Chroococcidiopsis sp. FACHB-1243]|uniref:iron uptake porin n=1 Tax=Chroococcidiopsis sp. [FACHB-1243] TaxID=2692781 RepID=UPI0017856A68|nr:iron uptake porin [Chroococcidiopsis sp. [FACHB-1243]]MBD2304528.1 carbohydrate porin [Chroococcidiopsis sp. [FACHB-1243]]